MATENNYDEILEEICEKVNNIEPIKEIDILSIKSSIESLEELITDTEVKTNFDDIKEKLEAIAAQVDNCNDALLKDLYTDINQLKDSSENVGQHLENLQNLQNLSLTSAQFEEYQKQQLDLALKTNENIFNELTAIKENSKVIDYSENINNLNTQLTNLHSTLTNYIEQLTTKIEGTPNLEEISSVMSDLGSVQQESIKQTKLLIKEFQEKFTAFQSDFKYKEIENQFSKISEIYDSLNIIRVWIEKVGYINKSIENVYARLGQSIDFDDVAEKVDIIYENIGSLNTWTQKIDNIDSTMTNTQSKLSSLSEYVAETKNISNMISNLKERFNSTFSEEIDFDDLSNKMDIAYENLTALNEWATKIDSANQRIEDVSEKVDLINNTLEDEMIASKVDLIYENIGLLNEWVSKIDDISQKSEELDNKYTQTSDNLNLKIDEITQTLVNASRIIEDVPNIKDKLEDLSGELNIITHSTKDDAESYIYTLLDIESDFLKLHKFLDDKTQTTTKDINALKEKFTELTDDISSISIRTNKLILSADDANKEFKSYLDSFKATIQELDNQKKLYNPELKLSLLDEKVNSMFGLMQSNLDTTKNLKSAFVFLAEWVDATGAMLNNMQDNINKLLEKENEKAASSETETRLTRLEDYLSTAKAETEAKLTTIEDNVSILKGEDVSEIKSTLTGIMMQLNTSLTPDIDSINERIDKVDEEHNEKFSEVEELMKEKIEEQEKHINVLEEKLNDMNTKFDDINAKFDDMSAKFDKLVDMVSENSQANEIKDILNYIATQTAAATDAINNQQGTTEVVKKVEEKLSSFDENINKIVSYIEED